MNFQHHKTHKILIIEDDPAILRGLEINLQHEGYKVMTARNGEQGLLLALSENPSLIILDIMLPGMNGYEVLSEIHKKNRTTSVLLLSAKGLESDKIMGLDLGADDYMTKPFSLQELLSRTRALLRRYNKDSNMVIFSKVTLDLSSHEVKKNGRLVELSSLEYDILRCLVEKPNRVLTRSQLIQYAWKDEYLGTERTIDNFIVKLRQKLEDDPQTPIHFLTIRGVGYKFVK